jgi:hypothetical protein
MRKEDFRQWLDGKIKKKPISDCISRCTTVEYALKVDLDEEYLYPLLAALSLAILTIPARVADHPFHAACGSNRE